VAINSFSALSVAWFIVRHFKLAGRKCKLSSENDEKVALVGNPIAKRK